MVNRSLDGYTDERRKTILELLAFAKLIDSRLEIYETGRSQLIQDAYYARGRENFQTIVQKYQKAGLPPPTQKEAGNIITWTRNSKHIDWKAVDIVFKIGDNWNWLNNAATRETFAKIEKYAVQTLGMKHPLPREDMWHFEFE